MRMSRLSLSLAIVVSLGLAASSGCPSKRSSTTPPPDKGGDSAAEFKIDFERYTLANGLTVILHRDVSDPIVAMATVVHVGSAREKPGRTGFAHFFEHMSFNNSENVPMGANRKYIPELGGTRNGFTTNDATVYYEVVPKDAFEKLMWIDSDRLGYMVNTVKEGTLEREKQVVKNEKRQRVDNRPYGHTNHVIGKALYPKSHPYNWTVIGDLEDLQAATLADVREFYFKYYVPGNATLVVAGDIDIAETKKMVEKWFGEIKAGEMPAEPTPRNTTLAAEKKLYHLDAFAKVGELRLTFPTVDMAHRDRWALDALGDILADGKKAPLYETVVMTDKLSSSARAYHDSNELAGTFTINVRANPGIDLDQVRASIDRALAKFEADGVRDTDLMRIKAKSETAFFSSLESILSRSLQLGMAQEFYDDANFIYEDRRRIAAVTKEDVLRVYRQYIRGKPAIVTSFVPKNAPTLIVEGSTEADVAVEKIVAGAEKKFTESDADDFPRTPTKHDRSEPPLGPRPLIIAPKIWQGNSPGGIAMLGIEQRELPMVEFRMRIDSGQQLDPTGKVGVARLTAEMLNEGTASKTPEQLQNAIELLGATLHISASTTSINVVGRSLSRNFDDVVALAAEMLSAPRWDAEEFDRLKTARLAEIAQRDGDPNSVARLVIGRLLYGDAHVAGQPFGGSAASVTAITLDDLKAFWASKISPKNATLMVAGAVSMAEAKAAMAPLDSQWKGTKVVLPRQPTPKAFNNAPPYFIDIPGSKQSVIYVGKSSVLGSDPRFYRMTVAVNRLGSGSSARLTQKLRIEKGYSYGAFGRFIRQTYNGPFIALSHVRANVTKESLDIFRDLIGNYRKTFTAKDLEVTKNLIAKADTRRYETLSQLLRVLDDMSTYNLPPDYIARQSKELQALTLEGAHALLDAELVEPEMIYLIVGDGATQLSEVAKFGRGKPIVLDRKGNPVAGK